MAIYTIVADGQTVYDSRNESAYPVRVPNCDLGINDAGTLEFTVIPGHPFYTQLTKMRTFVTAYRDDREIFYGRILSTSKDINGLLIVTCEGALTFFLDSDVPPGEYNESPSAFLSRCINAHNNIVEVEKRFTLGIITTERAINKGNVNFTLNEYTQTKTVLDNMLSSRYGGHFRVRPNPDGPHFLDYIESYERVNTQHIKIAENVVDKTDDISGETLFTILRPIGEDGLTLDSVTQNAIHIPGVIISGSTLRITDLITKYGCILRTESFSDAKDKSTLLTRAEDFITRHGTGPAGSCKIGFVDWSYLNPEVMDVRIGDTFTDIEGFADQVMTVSEQHLEFSNPGDDSITLKNPAELAMELSPDGPSGASGSGLSSMTNNQANSQSIGQLYKYIHEGEKLLQLHTDEIQVTAEKTLQLSGNITNITAGMMYLVAQEMPDPEHPGQMLPGEIQLIARETTADGDIRTTFTVSLGNVSVTNGNMTVDGYLKAQDIEAAGYVKAHDVEAMGYVKAQDVEAMGYIKTNELYAELAELGVLFNSDIINADEVDTNVLDASTAYIGTLELGGQPLYPSNTISMGSVASGTFWGLDDLSLAHSHAITASADGGVITITMGAEQSTGGTANFNIADTQFYKDGVSAAKASVGVTGSWDGSTFTYQTAESATKVASTTVSAGVTPLYVASTHKYICEGGVMVDGEYVDTTTVTTGTEAYDAGKAAMGMSLSGNIIRLVEGASAIRYSITSLAGITYNSGSHTYTAEATAKASGTTADTDEITGGTEAYDAGYQDGRDSMPTYTRVSMPLYIRDLSGNYSQYSGTLYVRD